MKNLINKVEELEDGSFRRKQTKWEKYAEDSKWYGDGAWKNMRSLKAKYFVGRHVDAVVRDYLHCMPEYERTREAFLDYLGIEVKARDGEYISPRGNREPWRRSIYLVRYFVNDQGVICKDRQTPLARPYKSRHSMTHEEIRKRFYEERSQRRKRVRDKKQADEIDFASLVRYLEWKRQVRARGFNPAYLTYPNIPQLNQ